MSNSHRLIILSSLFISPSLQALDVFFEPLYWQATETVDWVFINDRSLPNQNITYKTVDFDYAPGFRVGVDLKGEHDCLVPWDSKLYYTWYHTKATDSAGGNLVSTFLGAKLAQSGLFFYQSGQIHFKINFNMLDWDVGKSICVCDDLVLRPALGLRGGSIKQTISTSLQGPISVVENVKNNFRGVGPKTGIEGKWTFCRLNDYRLSLVSNFTTSYLWGRWKIRDITHLSNATTIDTKEGKRKVGAFTMEGMIGLHLDYDCFSMRFGYEIGDWFDQYQVLDDGTGAHNNDLILQGINLRLSYDF